MARLHGFRHGRRVLQDARATFEPGQYTVIVLVGWDTLIT
jgi:hypothetical protein